MTSSLALDTFRRLLQQVEEIERVAKDVEASSPTSAPILRRSAYVLAVAALDTFFHEKAVDILGLAVQRGGAECDRVAKYLSASSLDLTGAFAGAYVRLKLTFKTLVAPKKIDELLVTAGFDCDALWLQYCFGRGSRPDRERRILEILYDRRNQIAHEGDWDMVQLEFRAMTESHLRDCVSTVTAVAEGFETLV